MKKSEFDEKFSAAKGLFEGCSPLFIALGDLERQRLFLKIASRGHEGINVSELTEGSSLSRPAVSHHLKILKECGLIAPERSRTKIFYHVELDEPLERIQNLIDHVGAIVRQAHEEGN